MKDYQSLNHTRWDYKYHIAFITKNRKTIYGEIWGSFYYIFHESVKQKKREILERYL